MNTINVNKYKTMLKVGMGATVVAQSVSIDLQANKEHQDLIDQFISQLQQNSVSKNVEQQLLKLAATKYSRLEKKGAKKRDIEFAKAYDSGLGLTKEKVEYKVDAPSFGTPEPGAALFEDCVVNSSTKLVQASVFHDHCNQPYFKPTIKLLGERNAPINEEEVLNKSKQRAADLKREQAFVARKQFNATTSYYLQTKHGNTLENDSTNSKAEELSVEQNVKNNDYADSVDDSKVSANSIIENMAKLIEVDEPVINKEKGTYSHPMDNSTFTQQIIIPNQLYIVQKAVSTDVCAKLIEMYEFTSEEIKYQQSLADVFAKQFGRVLLRTSLRKTFRNPYLAKYIWETVRLLVPPQLEDSPNAKLAGIRSTMNFYKYSKGQYFSTHLDGGYSFLESGECSEYTFVLYLNDNFEGGSTQFCDVDQWKSTTTEATNSEAVDSKQRKMDLGARQINAKAGKLLIFRQRDMKHCGSPIINNGFKYIIQGMIMYSAASTNKLGKPVPKKAHQLEVTTCACD